MSPDLTAAWSQAWLLIASCGGHKNRAGVQAALENLIDVSVRERTAWTRWNDADATGVPCA